ncbi:1-deoxy-D-xylulose-5-phosphate synthase [Natranaerobius trueperi]|uniref:1-deoxy-D-xylulose-5-phosphate synthase n=1 Tax=Natranaerobius trueperi TaxID=759412 RepID=A0A226BZ05_9FIRM|nr:1-deoxy-D-xylulose-5-phosphate synthase [Natranaerobius trueperi]OWZ84012.1 1-deoxy-D-xylulose-5-phosphate synthase [Natranaerobius trueperi]
MYKLLDQINSPEDLQSLTADDLCRLSDEIRDFLISNVSKTGGHLAPNLGVVELSLALHSVFSTPKDKIVWDVGHQSYIHKILTGRKKQFNDLRKFKGLSGFPKPEESEHDSFATGHSSTSISAALGMAKARDLKQSSEKVVAVIGDGALTGGMAFEALNHAGHEKSNLTVILNDNEMSIGENVGAMSSYLSRLRTDPTYHRVKDDIEFLLKRIPAIGGKVIKSMERVKDSLKYLMVSGILFEEMGFTYLGPIDGHDVSNLLNVLKNAREKNGPVLVHVITKKGKGYEPAEKFPDKFHGVSSFDVSTGKPLERPNLPPKYSEVFGDTVTEIAKEDKSVVAITAAMKDGTGLKSFEKEFPERFFDVGIAEQHATTFAAGLASSGYKPVIALYSTFLQRAYDQITHDICLQNLPVVLGVDRAGIVGGDGETHQGLYDLSFLRNIPNLVIMSPKNEKELKDMISTGISLNKPVVIRYPRGCGEGVPLNEPPKLLPLYKGETLRKGNQIALVAVGKMVNHANKVAENLETHGISTTVYNARFIKPLDEEGIKKLASSHQHLCVFEENTEIGGFSSGVLEYLSSIGMSDKILFRFALPDKFIPQGERDKLLAEYMMAPEQISDKLLNFLRDEGEQVDHG